MVICLEQDADGCYCHPLSLASLKSRLVLPFWYWLTWVVPDKGPLNAGVCVCVCVCVCVWVCNTHMVSRRAESKMRAVARGKGGEAHLREGTREIIHLMVLVEEANNELLQILRGSLFHIIGAALKLWLHYCCGCQVLAEIKKHNLQVYELPPCDEDEDDSFKAKDKQMKATLRLFLVQLH